MQRRYLEKRVLAAAREYSKSWPPHTEEQHDQHILGETTVYTVATLLYFTLHNLQGTIGTTVAER